MRGRCNDVSGDFIPLCDLVLISVETGLDCFITILMSFVFYAGLNLAGPNGRFSKALLKKIANHPGAGGLASGNTAIMDEDVGRVMRQVCWQWGWQVNEAEWKRRVVGALAVGRGA